MSRPELTCTVKVQPLPEQSDPEAGQHAFAYTVTITNTGDVTAQVIARHWIISDERGGTVEVRGLAVVGQQPLLKPGESFEYTSWTPLPTSTGMMHGTFFCMTEDAHAFEAPIPQFALVAPSALH
jgi:ApaG protein